MARKERIWYPGAMYHVTSRGNRKGALFIDNSDYLRYLQLLEKTRDKYPFYLTAYCLMFNHVHLQLKSIDTDIQYIIKYLNGSYASYFNDKYDLVGHVFQGRYGAKLIETNQYDIDVSKYIHNNPVEAGLVELPEDYPWSSYRAYITNEKNPHVQISHLLSYFPSPQKENYLRFVHDSQTLKQIPISEEDNLQGERSYIR